MLCNTPVMVRTNRPDCAPKPHLANRSLIGLRQASGLGGIFKVLANDTRLRLLHALVREKELCVLELARRIGMKPQAVSNQLQRLVGRNILASRREGLQIFYRIVDPCVTELLDRGLCLLEDAGERS